MDSACNNGSLSWDEIFLSPPAKRAPDAVKLTETDDEISPTSSIGVSPPRFSFSTPKASRNKFRHHGFLSEDSSPTSFLSRRTHGIAAVTISALFWFWGCTSWASLLQISLDPVAIVPPPTSPSGLAKAAFSNLYERDWGAEPSLWVVLEASNAKRHLAPKHNSEGKLDSHSFADDTSVIYEQGKHFSYDLTYDLEEKFQYNGNSSVKVTSYYSLQEQGLDYVARHLVTPDGSKTIIKVQYLKDEIGADGEQELKKTILRLGRQNQPSYLNIHYTGETWNVSPTTVTASVLFLAAAGFVLALEATLMISFGAQNQSVRWGALAAASIMTTVSASSLVLTYCFATKMTSLALSSMFMVAFCLSIYFSKLRVDSTISRQAEASRIIRQSGGVLISSFGSLLAVTSSPTLQSVGIANTIAVISCVGFHTLLAPELVGEARSSKRLLHNDTTSGPKPSPGSRLSSLVGLCVSTCLLFMLASKAPMALSSVSLDRPSHTGFLLGDSPSLFHATGEAFGHGRLTPYRVLFDGFERNQSMVTLGGYDIQQMVVGELMGIAVDEDASPRQPGQEAGSTHIGEQYAEVQHLIKSLVQTLKKFKDEQQTQFDLYHERRQEHWLQQQMREESDAEDIKCDFEVNNGLSSSTYSGISMLENMRIPQSLYNAANICRGMDPRCPSEALHLLNVLEDETTPSHHLATNVAANLGVDPFSEDGMKWLHLARETIERLQADPRVLGGVQVHIEGQAAALHDFETYQAQLLPKQLLLVAGAILVALCLFMRAVLLPLRIMGTTMFLVGVSIGADFVIEDNKLFGSWIPKSSIDGGSPPDANNAFAVVLVCVLVASSVIVTGIAHDNYKARSSLAASTKVASSCMVFLCFILSASAKHLVAWPLIVAMGLLLDLVWVQNMVLHNLPSTLVKCTGQSSNGQCDLAADQSRHIIEDDIAAKFEDFLGSPRAR